MVAGPESMSRRHQRAAKILVVLKYRYRNCLRRIVRLKTVTSEQPGLDVIKLIVVLAPVRGAVQPIAAAAFEIADPRQLEILK